MKIEIMKAKGTKGNTLIINDIRVAGYESGFGYTLIDSFMVSDKEIKELLSQSQNEKKEMNKNG